MDTTGGYTGTYMPAGQHSVTGGLLVYNKPVRVVCAGARPGSPCTASTTTRLQQHGAELLRGGHAVLSGPDGQLTYFGYAFEGFEDSPADGRAELLAAA